MSIETLAAFVSVIVALGTGLNVWLTLRLTASIGGLKLWSLEKFVAKDDMSNYISPLKDAITVLRSARRLDNL
jgi:hypothetical protein